jgi:hypothetical protein
VVIFLNCSTGDSEWFLWKAMAMSTAKLNDCFEFKRGQGSLNSQFCGIVPGSPSVDIHRTNPKIRLFVEY